MPDSSTTGARAATSGAAQPEYTFKAGDALYGTFECRTVDTLLAFGSNGRVYSVPVSLLPGGRGDGQPITSLIELEVRREWLAVDEAAQRFATTATATGQADENLRVARDRYRNGVGTHTEVLDAEALRSLTDYNHLNALYDHHLARLRLRKAVGEL